MPSTSLAAVLAARPLTAQDTKRVYRDEINLIEVELLGREHSVRIAAERAAAEASGGRRPSVRMLPL